MTSLIALVIAVPVSSGIARILTGHSPGWLVDVVFVAKAIEWAATRGTSPSVRCAS